MTLLHLGYTQELRLLPMDIDSASLYKQAKWPETSYPTTEAVYDGLNKYIVHLHQQGFLEASVDTIVSSDQHYTALMHLGPLYQWLQLHPYNIPSRWLEKAGFNPRLYANKAINHSSWLSLQQSLSNIAADNGYPFAKIGLDHIEWLTEGYINAQIHIEKGPLIFFDELSISGDLQLSSHYIENYLGIKKGDLYNESLIQSVKQRLQELPFLRLATEPQVQFIGDQAQLILSLQPKAANRFDFIIGVLPKSQQTQKLLITTQLDAGLQNALGKGEQMHLSFEQLRPQVQELKIGATYPYLLSLPFGINSQLDLYRRDTNFINITWQAGVDYLLSGGRSVKAFINQQTTNTLSLDSFALALNNRLPDTLDIKRRSFGLGFDFHQFDYLNNPRKGWGWQVSISAGQRLIRPNPQIEEWGFAPFYDSIQLSSNQYKIESKWVTYRPLGQRSTIKLSLIAAGIIADQKPLINEQFRLGGNRQLRGFDEESIFTDQFILFTGEYRFLLSTNSFFYTFFDLALLNGQSVTTPFLPIINQGIGTGISFETKAGLFGLSLAFGRPHQQSFDIGAPKVHFGYISLF